MGHTEPSPQLHRLKIPLSKTNFPGSRFAFFLSSLFPKTQFLSRNSTKPRKEKSPMAEISSATISFPLIFSDGYGEIDAGMIAFDPSLGFEKLQFLISQKIGIGPHRFAIFLSRRKKPRSPETRKIPLHKNSDLTAIARERNCFFFAVSKPPPPPPKRDRRRKPRQEDCDRVPTLLRRNPEAMPVFLPPPEFIGQRLGLGFMDYEDKIRELQMGRDRYLYTNPYIYGRISGGMNKIVCEQCLSKERPIPFHLCVYDAVTVGFRSRAGPIERPSRIRS